MGSTRSHPSSTTVISRRAFVCRAMCFDAFTWLSRTSRTSSSASTRRVTCRRTHCKRSWPPSASSRTAMRPTARTSMFAFLAQPWRRRPSFSSRLSCGGDNRRTYAVPASRRWTRWWSATRSVAFLVVWARWTARTGSGIRARRAWWARIRPRRARAAFSPRPCATRTCGYGTCFLALPAVWTTSAL